MTFLNASSSIDQDPLMMEATDEQIATWLRLFCYCHRSDNHGKIENPRKWNKKMWGNIGIDKDVIDAPSPLWHLSPASGWLHVFAWDEKAQLNYLKKKEMGAKYVSRRKDRQPPQNGNGTGSHLDDLPRDR
jgi:hypothetical protein